MAEKIMLGVVKPNKPIGEMTDEERWQFAGDLAEFFKQRLKVARDAAAEAQ